MVINDQNLPELVKDIRKQLALSQEALDRELGIGFAIANRWENGQVKPSKLAKKVQCDNFCGKMGLMANVNTQIHRFKYLASLLDPMPEKRDAVVVPVLHVGTMVEMAVITRKPDGVKL